jgi:hypothetical protein
LVAGRGVEPRLPAYETGQAAAPGHPQLVPLLRIELRSPGFQPGPLTTSAKAAWSLRADLNRCPLSTKQVSCRLNDRGVMLAAPAGVEPA